MAVELHVVVEVAPYIGVDQPGTATFESPDVVAAGDAVLRALAATAPAGCGVVADHSNEGSFNIRGVRDHSLGRSRGDIGHQWQWGLNAGYPRGLVHSVSLLAPLTKHERHEDQHQVVVTVWDLRPWLSPETLPAEWVTWQRAMLKRAVKHADAIIVPSHGLGAQLEQLVRVPGRIRVIAPGVADAFEPRALTTQPEQLAAIVAASPADAALAEQAARDAGLEPVVINAETPVAERAELLARAAVLVNASDAPVWPWRVVEALQVGVPVVTVPSALVSEVVADAAIIAEPSELSAAITSATTTQARKLSVLGRDRSASFSWRAAAEQIWSLHADL